MPSILESIDAACREAFTAMGYPAQIAGAQESTRGDAPFQCNGALAAAGIAKKRGEKVNPRDIAGKAMEALGAHPMIEKMDIGGPGFINIYPTEAAISQRAAELSVDQNLGIEQPDPLSIIVDYGGANVAKPMHVGHLRSAVIGEAIKRLLRVQGHNVIGDVHMGDWGLQMGHLISELEVEQPDLPYFDATKTKDYPAESPVTMDDLARLYPKASNAAKDDKARMEC